MRKDEIIRINNLDHVVIQFKYVSGIRKGKPYFILLEEFNENRIKNYKNGKIYIIIPSWVEMQDVYQSSTEKNIMTNKYELSFDKLKMNKISKLCVKIETAEGEVFLITKKKIQKMHPIFVQFILKEIERVISTHYVGSGISKEEEKEMAYECYRYYSTMKKKQMGKKVTVPPCPGPILLMNICNTFNCTPDVARKISKRDIDLIMLAKEQESICEDPRVIGL